MSHTSSPRILFVLKRREFGDAACSNPVPYSTDRSSGLLNSVRFIVRMLLDNGVDCKLVQVIDNNCIDREVTLYRPSHVIVEALWVVPEKFDVLQKLHATVKWIVRIHSEIPFLANEGIAIDWLTRCVRYENVSIAVNSLQALRDLQHIVRSSNPTWRHDKIGAKVVYLPNYYPHDFVRDLVDHAFPADPERRLVKNYIDVACFGAIRPMKNNLLQAVAAIHYADKHGLLLRFHVNGTRNEQGGDNALKNLRALFNSAKGHQLVEHPWMPHEEFLKLMATMDLSLCVSFSETFCIVAADSIALGIPTVVSSEIEWASFWANARTTDSSSVVAAIERVMHPWFRALTVFHNRWGLREHCENAQQIWLRYFDCGPIARPI